MSGKNGAHKKANIFSCNRCCLVGLVFALILLVTFSLTLFVYANPSRSASAWNDDMTSRAGFKILDHTRVRSGKLILSPPDTEDLGQVAPGESSVHAVVATNVGISGKNIYFGTGENGHLVEFDPSSPYQEGYLGPTHFGVASTRGQAVFLPPQARVTALSSDGSLVYGGTYPDGYFFSFDPRDNQNETLKGCTNLGQPAGSGTSYPINSLLCSGGFTYIASENGHLYTYSGGAFTDLGDPSSSGSPLISICSYGTDILIGARNGHLYSYNGGFNDLGLPGGSAILSLTSNATAAYIGLENGHVYKFESDTFTDLGMPSGAGDAVKALANDGSSILYAGLQNGHLYKFSGTFSDLGIPPPGSSGAAINCLSYGSDGRLYGGCANGRIFRTAKFEDHGTISDLTDINAACYSGTSRLYFGSASGKLYFYEEPSKFTYMNNPDTSAINDLEAFVEEYSRIYIAQQSGHLWEFKETENSYVDIGDPSGSGSPLRTITRIGSSVYVGASNGHVYRYDIGGSGFVDLYPPGLGSPVLSSCASSSILYVGCENGHIYSWNGSSLTDLNSPSPFAINALCYSGGVYAGSEDGHLYKLDDDHFLDLGNCGSAIKSLVNGSSQVFCGTQGGELYRYDSSLTSLGFVPSGTSVLSLVYEKSVYLVTGHVFGGTAGGSVFSREETDIADRWMASPRQDWVWCNTYDPTRKLIYAGTYPNSHFVEIDPQTNKIVDRGMPIDGERELEDIIVTHDGAVYGCTYGGTGTFHNPSGGRLFRYYPETREFEDLGKAPAPDDNWWISAIQEGPAPDYLLYCSTSPSMPGRQDGCLFTYDPSTGLKQYLGIPVSGEGIRTLILNPNDGKIYGATWQPTSFDKAHLFRHEGGSNFTILGEPPVPPGGSKTNFGVTSICYSQKDGRIYGGQDNGRLFSYKDGEFRLETYYPGTYIVAQVLADENGIIWCGTLAYTEDGKIAGYNPETGEYTEVYTPAPGDSGIRCITFFDKGIFGGTYEYGRACRADIFVYTQNPAYALSVDVLPGLETIDTSPISGHESIGALCAGPGGAKVVYGGTSNESSTDAILFAYSMALNSVGTLGTPIPGQKKILSLCSDGTRYLYGGTGGDSDAHIFRYDTISGQTKDLGVPVAGAKGIFSLCFASNGRVYGGAGDIGSEGSWQGGRIFEYDPSSEKMTDKGVVNSQQGRVLSMVCGADGIIYGGTGVSPGQSSLGSFFTFNPSTGGITKRVPSEFGEQPSVPASAIGSDGKIYLGTSPGGKLVSYDTGNGNFQVVSTEFTDGICALVNAQGTLYGGDSSPARFFSYKPGSSFIDKGPVDYESERVQAMCTDNLGGVFIGTQGDHNLLRFNPSGRFRWRQATYVKSESPPVTNASVHITDEKGEVIPGFSNITSPCDLSEISCSNYPGLRFRASLSTTDETMTPEVDEWGLTWDYLPAIDIIESSYGDNIAYRGDYIYIWGSHFGNTKGEVKIGGASVEDYGSWHDSYVQVRVPQSASSGQVVLTTSDGKLSNTGTFILLDPPEISGLNPNHGYVGDEVEIRGTSFLSTRGSSTVGFADTLVSDYVSWSDTRIVVKVPKGARSGKVVVNVRGHESNGVSFTVLEGGNPSVEIKTPQEGTTVRGKVNVEADVSSHDEIKKVEFSIDGNVFSTDTSKPYSATWDSSSANCGSHLLEVEAIDNSGREGKSSVSFYVDRNIPWPSTHWYFAEGCTDYGFETFVLLGNPQESEVNAQIKFMDEDGAVALVTCILPPQSRTTINAYDWLPFSSVSIEVTSSKPIVCERAMYLSGRVEGHASIGATELSKEWYFAEGCTDYGFETFILVGNPADENAEVSFEYMFSDGKTHEINHNVRAHSRLTVNTKDEIGSGEFSLLLKAKGSGVIAERAMYANGRRCATATIGCRNPSSNWFFSEGSTDWGFETWLLMENPSEQTASITASYRLGDGKVIEKTYRIAKKSRYTINLENEVGKADVSTGVFSNVPIVCERSMYWGERIAGHSTIGTAGLDLSWYFAEGYTAEGFETWILLDNPWDEKVIANLNFMVQDGENKSTKIELNPHSRTSLNAGEIIPASSFTTVVESPKPIMAERAMYWNGRGGGTCSVGTR